MAKKVYFINSSVAQYSDEEFAWFQSLMLAQGIIGNSTGVMGLQVLQNTVPDMSVLVTAGKALVQVTIAGARTFKVVLESTAQEQITIPANSSGANRVGAVIVRVDVDTEPNALKTNVGTIEYIPGTSTSPLSDGAIQTAVGNDGWYRLANVTVTNGDVAIITSEIADTRVRVSATSAFDFANAVPVGQVSAYAGSVAPLGYLLCQGQAVSRATYATLFSVIGSDWGYGDGSTTFNLPDMRLRVPVGIDTSTKVVVEDCEDAWDEFTAANVTSSLDTSDKKVGSGSAKFVVGGAVSGNTILATEAISSLDIRGRTHLYFWIKSTVNTAAGDLQILLDDTALCASPVYTLSVPALVANQWRRVGIVLTHPAEPNTGSTSQALISIGIKMVTDLGAFTINLDDFAVGNAFEMGIVGGEEKHLLSINEMPSHTHTTDADYEAGGSGSGGTSGGDEVPVVLNPTGGGQVHNIMQPNAAMNYIIKY